MDTQCGAATTTEAGAAPVLNTDAAEFVPTTEAWTGAVDKPLTPVLNPHAPEFVPLGAEDKSLMALTLNTDAPEFVPTTEAAEVDRPLAAALNPDAREFMPTAEVGETKVPLNPSATEFVPWWRVGGSRKELSADAPEFVMTQRPIYPSPVVSILGYPGAHTPVVLGYPAANLGTTALPTTGLWRRQRPRNYSQEGRARFSYRIRRTQKPEFVRRTVFVTDIDHTVTEESLALLFGNCGNVVDCRVCGDPTTGLRFSFIEFEEEEDAFAALHLNGVIIGICPLKVSPSRTAIMPVNPSFLPQNDADREMCSRTVYCTNIHKSVVQGDLQYFCQYYFGEVSRIRLLGDESHATRIAFIEFKEAISAVAALRSTGIYAGGIPIRVSPSKTPIRTRGRTPPPRCDAASRSPAAATPDAQEEE